MTATLTGAAARRLVLLGPALLAACSTAPLSFIEGRPVSQVEANLQPLTVVAIDGRMEGGSRASVGPGTRSVVLAAPPARGMRTGTAKAFAMNVEPCTRYLVAARRASPMSPDWQLVVQDKEKVAGCDAAEEWRKTGQPVPAAAPAGAPAPVPQPLPAS